jgi:hypothetical protein
MQSAPLARSLAYGLGVETEKLHALQKIGALKICLLVIGFDDKKKNTNRCPY